MDPITYQERAAQHATDMAHIHRGYLEFSTDPEERAWAKDTAAGYDAIAVASATYAAALRTREQVPPVIATIPAALGSVEVCVRHQEWGVEVDVRSAGSRETWTPIGLVGGSFEVRSS